ncbi:DUF6193 family natural product biosynthesis protein [Streptomyces sp. BPTC-684]|uniref:DUF6193 family natural product biosynthesis protein n=1 Tax=Streptomyces sp. BPTC-684 TaxID=3043734 RepID=UPI0024B07791|nr:DUF6193 family natural product biosynthesis protein [Streptomyces sp. BPTC-684]WHM41061.1 DUF6193 family natural product biosynthesis protein [Streptomyces sp. BPTC-684]
MPVPPTKDPPPRNARLGEAAHADPRLRQLYVYSSHWTLGFSLCTGFPFRDEVAIPCHTTAAPADRRVRHSGQPSRRPCGHPLVRTPLP